MTPSELRALPVILSWEGPVLTFQTDQESCITHLVDIIHDMNLMQDPEYVSLPVGKE